MVESIQTGTDYHMPKLIPGQAKRRLKYKIKEKKLSIGDHKPQMVPGQADQAGLHSVPLWLRFRYSYPVIHYLSFKIDLQCEKFLSCIVY